MSLQFSVPFSSLGIGVSGAGKTTTTAITYGNPSNYKNQESIQRQSTPLLSVPNLFTKNTYKHDFLGCLDSIRTLLKAAKKQKKLDQVKQTLPLPLQRFYNIANSSKSSSVRHDITKLRAGHKRKNQSNYERLKFASQFLKTDTDDTLDLFNSDSEDEQENDQALHSYDKDEFGMVGDFFSNLQKKRKRTKNEIAKQHPFQKFQHIFYYSTTNGGYHNGRRAIAPLLEMTNKSNSDGIRELNPHNQNHNILFDSYLQAKRYFRNSEPWLVVIDDIMQVNDELFRQIVTSLFAIDKRHMNISTIFLTQHASIKNFMDVITGIRANTTYIHFFTPRDSFGGNLSQRIDLTSLGTKIYENAEYLKKFTQFAKALRNSSKLKDTYFYTILNNAAFDDCFFVGLTGPARVSKYLDKTKEVDKPTTTKEQEDD